MLTGPTFNLEIKEIPITKWSDAAIAAY